MARFRKNDFFKWTQYFILYQQDGTKKASPKGCLWAI